ncbi:MAG: hypothetical protein WDN28_03130, partial [Chthoniobacter sp.]
MSDLGTTADAQQPINRVKTTAAQLTPVARQTIYDTSNATFHARVAADELNNPLDKQAWVGVAEGDSWFDYLPAFLEDPLKGDLLAQLHHTGKFHIFNLGKAVTHWENMAYGTDVGHNAEPIPCQLIQTVATVKQEMPDFFLLSAGGNDLSGDNGVDLEFYLNHASSGPIALRSDRALETFHTFNRKAVESIILAIMAAQPSIQIFMHGYDYAMPDGRAVFQAPFGYHFIGPWLLPAFARQRIWPDKIRYDTIVTLIDMHNDMIIDLAKQYPFFHHIDCRRVLQRSTSDWANELHPTVGGFTKIANRFAEVILSVLEPKQV